MLRSIASRVWHRVRGSKAANSYLERSLASAENAPTKEPELVQRLMASYVAASAAQKTASSDFLPASGWARVVGDHWSTYRTAIEDGNAVLLATLLRNFFRNEGISGLWGGNDMFAEFRDHPSNFYRASMMEAHYHLWRQAYPEVDVAELAAPPIGNPWGYAVDGHTFYEPVFEYDFEARQFRRMLTGIGRPTVLEIGGGFGGLASHIIRQIPGVCYVAVDLPEVLLIQSYFLSSLFPEAKILTFSDSDISLDQELLAAHDIILMPNFMLPKLGDKAFDLIVNVRSLSEMPAETITTYLANIDRVGRRWFYHENIYRKRTDNLHGIPSSDFPRLEKFILVTANESRWPKYAAASSYPCQENIFLHREIVAAHQS